MVQQGRFALEGAQVIKWENVIYPEAQWVVCNGCFGYGFTAGVRMYNPPWPMPIAADALLQIKIVVGAVCDVLQAQLGQPWSGSDKSRLKYMYDT